MKRPSIKQRELLEAIDAGAELERFGGLLPNRGKPMRYTMNTWPAKKVTVETCIKHGWIEVQPALFGAISTTCVITIKGQEAIW